jgi:hypothetical protein
MSKMKLSTMIRNGGIMKSAIVVGLLLVLCFPAFGADRNKLSKIDDLDRQVSMIITNENAISIQMEDLRSISRELDDLVASETDPEVIARYQSVKTRIRDLFPSIR